MQRGSEHGSGNRNGRVEVECVYKNLTCSCDKYIIFFYIIPFIVFVFEWLVDVCVYIIIRATTWNLYPNRDAR